MSDNIIHVNDEEFEEKVLASEAPVLVDFWAEWCAPCKMIAPVLEQIAEHYGDRIKIAKVDVDSNKQTAIKFNIRSIPTLMVFKNGQPEGTKMGAMNKTQLTSFIDGCI